jgi:hypothetical protein
MSVEKVVKYVNADLPFVLNDNYLFFTWNEINSQSYNCFIENKNDLQFILHPSFSNNFETPLYQNTRYYLGTSTEGKEFSLNLCFYGLTLDEFRKALSNWLTINSTALFQFDYDKWYGYNCKLKSVGEAKKNIVDSNDNGEDLYLIEVTISFETVEYAYAICKDYTFASYNYATQTVNSSLKINLTLNSGTPTFNKYEIQEVNPLVYYYYNEWTDSPEGTFNSSVIVFTLNNMGDLNTPFSFKINGITSGNVQLFLTDVTPSAENISSLITPSKAIAWWELNNLALPVNQNEPESFPVQYDSDTGLLTIQDRPANMTICNRNTALLYNRCQANVSLGTGCNYLLLFINDGSPDLKRTGQIDISFLKRTTVI